MYDSEPEIGRPVLVKCPQPTGALVECAESPADPKGHRLANGTPPFQGQLSAPKL